MICATPWSLTWPNTAHADAVVPTIFSHVTRDTVFELVVDDFCVKYNARTADAEHLIAALSTKYTIKVDMAAKSS
jgi:hypothetical protein